jgi:RIO kinase 1
MKAPESLETLLDYGIIQEVVRPLMSGKEAQVYVVVANGVECVAKVYKEAHQRTFKHRSDYTEGRRTRNTRDQRAMSKRTQHGRKQDEAAWRNTEVDMIYRLRDAGVRVPEPLNYVEGVLVMELVKDAEGYPAPRLGDMSFSASEAETIHRQLLREVVRMLCAGVVHGDLSEFNVLMSADGPVVIDFPQAVDPAHNPSGQKLLLRDVENLTRFLARFAPGRPVRPYGPEIWSLYQANRLKPDTVLKGDYKAPEGKADTADVMALIADARRDEARRRAREEDDEDPEEELAAAARAPARVPFRTVVDLSAERSSRPGPKKQPEARRPTRGRGGSPGVEARSGEPSGRDRGRGVGPAGALGSGSNRNGSEAPARREATGAEDAKSPGARRRRRRSRNRSRGASSDEAPGTDAKSEGVAGAKPPSPGASSPAPVRSRGDDRPPRRRRRRPRKAGAPK